MVTTSPRRRITILSTLTIVAFGAVALTGLWHPNAPTEAMQLYLPRITLPTAAVFLTHLGLGIGLLKTLDFFHASISPCQAGRARRDSVWPVDDQGFLPARHGMASASSITGGQACATNGKKGHCSGSRFGWLLDWSKHRALQWSSLSRRFEFACSAAVRNDRIRLSGAVQPDLCTAPGNYTYCCVRSSNIEPTGTLESSP